MIIFCVFIFRQIHPVWKFEMMMLQKFAIYVQNSLCTFSGFVPFSCSNFKGGFSWVFWASLGNLMRWDQGVNLVKGVKWGGYHPLHFKFSCTTIQAQSHTPFNFYITFCDICSSRYYNLRCDIKFETFHINIILMFNRLHFKTKKKIDCIF